MRAYKFFLASAVLLVLGLASLGSQWNGSAGIRAGDSIAEWAVTFNGSVHGWPALIGLLLIVAGILVFLAAAIRALVGPPFFDRAPARK